MQIDQTAFNLIATSLSKHFDSLYYVDIETGEFEEFIHSQMLDKLNIPKHGSNFFSLAGGNDSFTGKADHADNKACGTENSALDIGDLEAVHILDGNDIQDHRKDQEDDSAEHQAVAGRRFFWCGCVSRSVFF